MNFDKNQINKITRPWGYEGTIISTQHYSTRVLVVKENEKTPYLYFKKRDRTIYVLQGIVHLTLEGTGKTLNEGDRYHIRPKVMSRITALKGDATIIETGTYLEDEDIIVVEK